MCYLDVRRTKCKGFFFALQKCEPGMALRAARAGQRRHGGSGIKKGPLEETNGPSLGRKRPRWATTHWDQTQICRWAGIWAYSWCTATAAPLFVMHFRICVAHSQQTLEFAEKLRPDVIVMDLQMAGPELPARNGWWVLRELKKKQLTSKVVILSYFDLPQIQHATKFGGCYGFVSKLRATEDLVTAIHAAVGGNTFFHGVIVPHAELFRAAPPGVLGWSRY